MIPEDLRYTSDHEWVRVTEADVVRVGITDYAQRQLGDVVFVQLPEIGQRVTAGSAIGEVESTKSVSEVFAPVSGEILAANEELTDHPELINAEPYGAGWLCDIRPEKSVADSVAELLDAASYRSLTSQS